MGGLGGSDRAFFWLAALICSCSPRAAESVESARLELAPRAADVWSFELAVTGKVVGRAELSGCWISIGNSRSKVELQGGAFRTRLALNSGENRVQAGCDGQRGRELLSAPIVYNVPLPALPRAALRASVERATLRLDASESRPSEQSRAPLVSVSWSRIPELGLRPVALGSGSRLDVPLPTADGDYIYELEVRDARGASDSAQQRILVRNGTAQLDSDVSRQPSSLEGGVVYGVVPALYGKPPLRALKEQLASLSDLGVSALWLSPIFETPPGDYGYAVTDYLRVRSDYGTGGDLRELVDEAHRQKLRVLLDLVPNHTSAEHPYFRDSAAFGPSSHYFGFYERDAAGQPQHYFDWANLPNLDYGNREVRNFMNFVGVYWLRNFGVDGYRIDAVWGVRERAPGYLPNFSRELRRVRADAVLLAEASARDPFYFEHGFEGAYDWTNELGHWAWEHVFDSQRGIAARLSAAIAATAQATPLDRVLHFLNNNDTGERFVTRHGISLTKVATVLLLTLPGIPSLFSFDEVGAEFLPYSASPLAARAHPELREFHRELIRLRRTVSALRAPGFRALALDAAVAEDVYAYLRHSAEDASSALVVLNFADQARTVEFELPPELTAESLRDVSSGRSFRAARRLRLELSAFGYALLLPVKRREGGG